MLQPSLKQRYQVFQQALKQLQNTAITTDGESALLRDNLQTVQQLFKSQISNLSAEDITENEVSRWQSVQTEIYKQMRLLETDMMRLQAARSSATSLSRSSGVRIRINTLIQYCEALLQM